jgi:hypothetical protein
VTRHRDFPGAWLLMHFMDGTHLEKLDATELEAAKVEASQRMAKWLRTLLADLPPEAAGG